MVLVWAMADVENSGARLIMEASSKATRTGFLLMFVFFIFDFLFLFGLLGLLTVKCQFWPFTDVLREMQLAVTRKVRKRAQISDPQEQCGLG